MKKNDGNFFSKVYETVRRIPRGKVASYGFIAAALGSPRMGKFVGFALHVNPDNGITPCHRVVTKDGGCSVAFKFGGVNIQKEMLMNEGVVFSGDNVLMEKYALKSLTELI